MHNEAVNVNLPITTQQAFAANRELIARFEKKIQAILAHVWGEETSRGEAQ